MVIRFFMLQAHYRSPLDITDHGLESAEKGYKRLLENKKALENINPANTRNDGSESDLDRNILHLIENAYQGMDDDFNTAIALAALNEIGSIAHKIVNQQTDAVDLNPWVLERVKTVYNHFISDIFGLADEVDNQADNQTLHELMDLILEIRTSVRTQKDWATSDKIRDALTKAGIQIKDSKEGATWSKL
jgi:cysteinyl-tRNA synthetase